MTRPPPPATLEEALAEAFRLLARGVADRRSPLHTPTLATIGLDGAPRLRTVVLRGFDAAARRCRIHTDRRSAKVAELLRDPRAALHGYDPGLAVQLRLEGRARVHADDAVADAAWATSRPASRACYAIGPAPGSAVAAPPPAPEDAHSGRANFAVVELEFAGLEWLHLDSAGHRRAGFAWDGGAPAATWLVP